MDESKTIAPLTGLRFFAAMAVVLYHTSGMFLPQVVWLSYMVRDGNLGVSLFFVLSGFILSQVYLVQREPPIDRRSFYRARFARIYPVFVAGLVIHAPFVIAHFFSRNAPTLAAAKATGSLAANLLMLQAWAPPLGGGWDGPGWTLSTETFFYLTFPFLVPWLFRWPVGRLVVAVLVVEALSLMPWLTLRLIHGPDFEVVPRGGLHDWLERFPPLHLHEFLIGVLACRLSVALRKRERWSSSRWSTTGAASFIALASILVAMPLSHVWPGSRHLIDNGLLPLLFAGLILALAHGSGPLEGLLGSRTVVLLGGASYAIYLMHIPLLFWFYHFWPESCSWAQVPQAASQDSWQAFGAYLVMVIGLSCACFLWFEEPSRRWLRGRPAPQRSRSTTDALRGG